MSLSHHPSIVKNGLVAYFDAANPKSYKPSSDPYFSAVSLLLSMNGANGSTTFTDSSSNALAVTAVGNAQISTAQSKYGGSAGYFDGSGDYASIPDSSAPVLGSSDWTIEAWIYISVAKSFNAIYAKRSPGGYGFGLQVDAAGNLTISASTNGSSWALAGSSLGSGYGVGSWIHVAVVRSGNTITGYKNGVSTGTQTLSGAIWPSTGHPAAIGSGLAGDTSQDFNGYIDDLRISRFARYLSNFTPPNTSLPAIASTVTYDPYYIKTSLLLHMDGANNSTTFTDSGPNALAVTAVADAKISTAQSKFGGSAAYFDGTGDYLTVASNAAIAFGLGDFTIECWVYFSALPTTGVVMGIANTMTSPTSAGFTHWWIGLYNNAGTNLLYLGRHGNGAVYAYSNWTPALNTWYHIAATRSSSSVIMLFIDGVSQSVTTSGANWANDFSATGSLIVGYVATLANFNGYIDDFRLTRAARYAASFTPPTTALIEYAPEDDRYFNNVSLLLHMDGANNSTTFIDSSSNNYAITTGLNAKISTAQSKYGGSSANFSATNDFLSFSSTAFSFGTDDFTVECWIYVSNYGSSPHKPVIIGSGYNGLVFYLGNDGTLWCGQYGVGNNANSTGVIPLNTWTHVAVTRSGSTARLFINGTIDGIGSWSATLNGSSTPAIGIDPANSLQKFTGYIDDFRITKGISRYNSNFTIPSSAYPDNTYTPVTATVIDLTKNKITGTFTNGVDYNIFNGGSLVFDGTSSYVSLGTSSNLNFGTGDFTIDCWYNLSATTPNDQGILNDIAGTFSSGSVLFKARQNSSGGKVSLQAYDFSSIGNRIVTSSTTIAANTWYNATITRIGNSFTLYINGRSESTGTFAGSMNFNNNNGTYIGYSILDAANGYLNGRIPSIKIYKGKGLTSTEVLQNYNATKSRYGY